MKLLNNMYLIFGGTTKTVLNYNGKYSVFTQNCITVYDI